MSNKHDLRVIFKYTKGKVMKILPFPPARKILAETVERGVEYVVNSGSAKYLGEVADSFAKNKHVEYVTGSKTYKTIDKYVLKNVSRVLTLVKKHLNLILIKAPNKGIDLVELHVSKIYNFARSGVSKVWNKIHPAKEEVIAKKVEITD
jgi:hypothetical protein